MLHFPDSYTLRSSRGPLACANLLARHLALILVLIALQILSFWDTQFTGNLLNNNNVKEFSLAGSRRSFSKFPCVAGGKLLFGKEERK